MSSFSLIVAVNDEEVLNTSLLASPDIKDMCDIVLQTNPPSAAIAFNEGIRKAQGDILIFAHQDVFLPAGWHNAVSQAIHCLNQAQSKWAVLGVFGIGLHGRGCGYVYSTGLKRYVGSPMPEPALVQSLDEMVLILRADEGIMFDEALPGFHLYGTDLCLTARIQGRRSYAIQAFCIHNSNGHSLPPAFWPAYAYMRRKWVRFLPVRTPCTTLTRWGWPGLKDRVRTRLGLGTKPEEMGRRVSDPTALYEQLQLYGQTQRS
jgi:hypothetical protein